MRVIHLIAALGAGFCGMGVTGCSYSPSGPSLSADDPAPASSPAPLPISPTPSSMQPPPMDAESDAPPIRKSKRTKSEAPDASSMAANGGAPESSTDDSAVLPQRWPKTLQPPGPVASPGAETPGGPNQENSARTTDPGSSFDNLEVVDASLNGQLAVLRVGSQPTPNNLLSVFAGLKNRTTHGLALEVQTIYKDKAGNALNSGGWIPMTLKPHEETEYRSASISAEAADFLVRVRRSHETDPEDAR